MKKKVKKDSEVREPIPPYQKAGDDNRIHFFSSFDEQEEYHRKQMALLTHKELLDNLAQMRRLFFREYLLPDGNWKPMDYIIRINTTYQ